jgi:transcriptional regulator with XRE-family HTH domain
VSKSNYNIIRQKRLEKGYTLDMVAKSVGVSLNYISKLEKGETENPSDDVLVKLASTLGIDEDVLFHEFGKITVSAKDVLEHNPIFAKAFSQIKDMDNLSEDAQNELREKFIHWYKELSNKDDKH